MLLSLLLLFFSLFCCVCKNLLSLTWGTGLVWDNFDKIQRDEQCIDGLAFEKGSPR